MSDHAARLDSGAAAGQPGRTPDGALLRKLVWVTLFRMVTITVLLGGTAVVNWEMGERASGALAPLYAIIAATYAASAALAALLRMRWAERALAAAEVALDVAIAAAVVATTGLQDSVFVFLFLLAIVNGGILLHRRGAAAATALALATYAGLVLALHPAPGQLRATLFAHGSAFLAVGALAGYLAEQLRRTGERLVESESDLAAVTARHESIVQSVASGLLTLDRKGRITFLNRAGEQMTGLALADVARQPAEAYFPRFEHATRGEAILSSPSRGRRLLGYTSFELRVSEGHGPETAVIFQDLTEMRAMEESVERSRRLVELGQVAAGLAHEVRNPLASISGCVELLRVAKGLSEEDQRVLGIVLRETGRLDQLLTRFLEFTRPAPPHARRVDLALVTAETLEVFARDPAASAVEIERALAPTSLECDPDQIRQVLWNLLVNAAQAMRESGKGRRIRVACAPLPDGGASLAVEDDGPGIPPADAARVFTPFFTTKANGTGLGLAVVQRIADAHGGSVSAGASPEGGARFALRLPAGPSAGGGGSR